MRSASIVILLASLGVVACSKSENAVPAAQTAPVPKGPSAAQQYVLYEQMLAANSAELAVPLGDEILRTFPDSPEAAKVREQLEDLREKSTRDVETRRMSRLWTYQTAPMAGGTQSTATIYNRADPALKGEQVRLVLRRHTEWGESVFLYGSEPGYTCGKPCRVTMRFDDNTEKRYLGSIPPTGEPAIFIEEDEAFIAALKSARKVAIELNGKGQPKQTLVYEVGGFDAEKYLPLPSKKK